MSSDTTAAFLPWDKTVDKKRLAELLQLLDKNFESFTPIQELQRGHLRGWIEGGKVPSIEVIQFTRGLIAPEEYENYIILAGSLMVSFICPFAHSELDKTSCSIL